MKKNFCTWKIIKVLAIFAVLILMTQQAYGRIEKEYDEGKKTVMIISRIEEIAPWESIWLIKNNTDTLCVCLGFSKVNYEGWNFSENDISIQFNNDTYKAESVLIDSKLQDDNTVLSSALYCNFDEKFIDELKSNQRVYVRVPFSDHSSITWEVPLHVLNEWRIVAATYN